MASNQVKERVKRHRDALRQAGMRPIQMWVPDTRQAGFAQACVQQSARVALADQGDDGIIQMAELAAVQTLGWQE